MGIATSIAAPAGAGTAKTKSKLALPSFWSPGPPLTAALATTVSV